jgi:mucin-19
MSLETMTRLASTTVGVGGTASVTFSNIPQNYTDLCIKISCRTDRAADEGGLGVQLNSSTTGQTYRVLAGSGSNGTGSVNTAYEPLWVVRIQGANAGTGIFSSTELYIPNYSGNTSKTILGDSATEKNDSIAYITVSSVVQPNSSPVTSITLSGISGTLQQHSVFNLYGVKNMAQTAGNSIKATGGDIQFDGTYVYHVFDATSIFVANQPLLADVVSVGGGGGGGWNNAGGGGGGELDIARNLSISANTSTTVTIGAGGSPATSVGSAGGDGSTTRFSIDVTSLGGGGGGTGDGPGARTGGSGGGGALSNSGAAGTGSNTNSGGTGFAVGGGNGYGGGGGGGATTAGGNASSATRTSGAGGVGMSIASIFSAFNLGNITHLGSGGSGGVWGESNTAFLGTAAPNGGTGAREGTNGNINPVNATANAGGGGGGGAYTGVNSRSGSNGGSGLVIVRYKG